MCACVMGNTESMESQLAVIRSRAVPVRLPMPDPAELEERFSIALVNAQPTYASTQHTQVYRKHCMYFFFYVIHVCDLQAVKYNMDYIFEQ